MRLINGGLVCSLRATAGISKAAAIATSLEEPHGGQRRRAAAGSPRAGAPLQQHFANRVSLQSGRAVRLYLLRSAGSLIRERSADTWPVSISVA